MKSPVVEKVKETVSRADERPRTAAGIGRKQAKAFKTIEAAGGLRPRPVMGLKTDIQPTIVPQSQINKVQTVRD